MRPNMQGLQHRDKSHTMSRTVGRHAGRQATTVSTLYTHQQRRFAGGLHADKCDFGQFALQAKVVTDCLQGGHVVQLVAASGAGARGCRCQCSRDEDAHGHQALLPGAGD